MKNMKVLSVAVSALAFCVCASFAETVRGKKEFTGDVTFHGNTTVKGANAEDAVLKIEPDAGGTAANNWTVEVAASDGDLTLKAAGVERLKVDKTGLLTADSMSVGSFTVTGAFAMTGATANASSIVLTNSANAGACSITFNADKNDDAGDLSRLLFGDNGGMAFQTDKDVKGTLATKWAVGEAGIVTMKGGATLDNTTSATELNITEDAVKVTGTFTATGNTTLSGTLTHKLPVVTALTNTLTAAQSGSLVLLNTDSVCNLPAVSGLTGVYYDFLAVTVATTAPIIDPNASEVIVIGAAAQTGGESVEPTAIGDSMRLVCDGTAWRSVHFNGTWAGSDD